MIALSFEAYIKEMKRLGWSDEELSADYHLHEISQRDGLELPWFPIEKSDKQKTADQKE